MTEKEINNVLDGASNDELNDALDNDNSLTSQEKSNKTDAAVSSAFLSPRSVTRRVQVGDVPLGGGAPIAVQSMLFDSLSDVAANIEHIAQLKDKGCEIIRLALPHKSNLDDFEAICKGSVLPVVADIHFNPELAIEAARRGAAKLRINPGNLGGVEYFDAVIDQARSSQIPLRIGVNAGSLDKKFKAMESLSTAEKLVASVKEYVHHAYDLNFEDLVVSAKVHSVPETVEVYRRLSVELPEVPLHIGVTEAGTEFQGLIKSGSGLGILLHEGIGDTLRISLTGEPASEVRAAHTLLSCLGLRHQTPELISCPTCGRCEVDMIPIAQNIETYLTTVHKSLKVAVMGCVVNGPGEAQDADIGVACGKGSAMLFRQGKVIRKISEEDIYQELIKEIEQL